MISSPVGLLTALAVTLREQVGPAVADPFPKTQAFMAAVILEKLAGQLRAGQADDSAALAERAQLVIDIRNELGDTHIDDGLRSALDALAIDGGDSSWSALVAALYATRAELGEPAFERLLGRLRVAMRARLNRALAYAR